LAPPFLGKQIRFPLGIDSRDSSFLDASQLIIDSLIEADFWPFAV